MMMRGPANVKFSMGSAKQRVYTTHTEDQTQRYRSRSVISSTRTIHVFQRYLFFFLDKY